jgi:hypothetical protein
MAAAVKAAESTAPHPSSSGHRERPKNCCEGSQRSSRRWSVCLSVLTVRASSRGSGSLAPGPDLEHFGVMGEFDACAPNM